jgi:hypothetical protein
MVVLDAVPAARRIADGPRRPSCTRTVPAKGFSEIFSGHGVPHTAPGDTLEDLTTTALIKTGLRLSRHKSIPGRRGFAASIVSL